MYVSSLLANHPAEVPLWELDDSGFIGEQLAEGMHAFISASTTISQAPRSAAVVVTAVL
jgi:hypothetical protein